MINTFSNLKEIFLKYTFYFFPLLIILGNALVNFFFYTCFIFILRLVYN